MTNKSKALSIIGFILLAIAFIGMAVALSNGIKGITKGDSLGGTPSKPGTEIVEPGTRVSDIKVSDTTLMF